MHPTNSSPASLARIAAACAPLGALVLLVSTMLHPLGADPNDAAAAFAEYAADPLWVWSHLGQFVGVAVLAMAFVGLAATFEAGRAAAWGRLGFAGIVATIAAAAALQAVDGVALKVMVDRWAAATGAARDASFEAAFAVRQIEIGLASLLNVLFGFTSVLFGVAIISSARYPAWLGIGGLAVGLAMLASGGAMAVGGFSEIAMALSMTASFLFVVWLVVLAVLLWRLAHRLQAGLVDSVHGGAGRAVNAL